MADRYWVGGSGLWSDYLNHWSATSGGAPGASVPTSSDNVIFDALSNATAYTVTVDGSSRDCRDMTWGLPGTSGVPTLAGTFALNIYGSAVFAIGMNVSKTGGFAWAGSASGKTITTNGVSFITGWAFQAAGNWTLQDDLMLDTTSTLTVSAGTLNTNAKTVTCGFFVSMSGIRTLTLTNSTINITGTSGTPWSVSSAGALTLTMTGSTINFTGNVAGVVGFSQSSVLPFATVNITGSGPWQINTGNTFSVLNYTSTTAKTDSLTLTATITIAAGGSLTITGNSTVNRAFVKSSTLGTQRNISVPSGATVSLTNVDFQDIASAGTFGTWTGTSLGDCLGNSGITFDPSATQTFVGGIKNWDDITAWTSRVPLPQDDVVLPASATGSNLTANMPRICRNMDATAYDRTWTNSTFDWTVFGNFAFGASTTYSTGSNPSTIMQGRGAHTFASGGKGFGQTTNFQAFGGSYTLQDNLLFSGAVSIRAGSFDTAGFNITAPFGFLASGSSTVNLRSSTIAVGAPSGGSGLTVLSTVTLDAGTSTIVGAWGNSGTFTFAGGGKTYYNFNWSSTTATGTLIITGANTFNDFRVDGTTARTVQFPANTTQTMATFTAAGADASHKISLTSSTPGSQFTLLGTRTAHYNADYLSIQDSNVTGGTGWYAGAGSTSVSNNTGWTFTAAPAYDAPVTEAATLVDSAGATAEFSASVSEIAAMLEATAAIGIYPGAIAEAETLAEALSAVGTYPGALDEAGSLNDTLSALGTYEAALAETANLAETMGTFVMLDPPEGGSASVALPSRSADVSLPSRSASVPPRS